MKRNTFMEWFTIIGLSICSLGVVIFSVIQQIHQKNEAIESKEDQLRQKDELITELKDIITGGDSYLFIRPSKLANSNDLYFTFEHRGKYPLYDVTIHYKEYDIIYPTTIPERYLKATERSVPIGTINPMMNEVFQISTINHNNPDSRGKRIFFKITSRNTLVEEEVFIRHSSESYTLAYSVVTMTPDYESSPPGYVSRHIKKRIRNVEAGFPVDEIVHLHGDTGWSGEYEETSGTPL